MSFKAQDALVHEGGTDTAHAPRAPSFRLPSFRAPWDHSHRHDHGHGPEGGEHDDQHGEYQVTEEQVCCEWYAVTCC